MLEDDPADRDLFVQSSIDDDPQMLSLQAGQQRVYASPLPVRVVTADPVRGRLIVAVGRLEGASGRDASAA